MFLGFRCPSFLYEVFKAYFSYDMTSKMLHHWPLFEYVSNHTGMEMHSPSQVALLYSIFETQASLNESLPHWAKDIFPDGEMSNVTLLDYYILSRTPLQKKLIGGVFIKEILGNILDYIRGIMPRERKLMLYSGNDRNIVGILNALDVWSPHIPNEGASVIFETYFDNETDIYGLKINYYTGVDDDTIPLTIPNCTEICPLEKFINIVFDMIPENTKALCYEKIESPTTSADFNHGPAMSLHKLCDVILILVCVSTFFVY
ncbi:venom acid phosphatase Acph-1 [Augochlora pura]